MLLDDEVTVFIFIISDRLLKNASSTQKTSRWGGFLRASLIWIRGFDV